MGRPFLPVHDHAAVRRLAWALLAGTAACAGPGPDGGPEDGDAALGEEGVVEAVDRPDVPDAADAPDTADGACRGDDDCRDDLFCNGAERCVEGACVAGGDPCEDDIDCTSESCDEEADRCRRVPDDASCADDVICNGEEVCAVGFGCTAGFPPDCRDDDVCTVDLCREAAGGCVHLPRDLDGDGSASADRGCAAAGGADCDDLDPAVHPGAAEVCDDGTDNDCDTAFDLADPDCIPGNDTCAGAMPLEEGVTVTATTRLAVDDYAVPCETSSGGDVAFSYTLLETRDVVLAVASRTGERLSAVLEQACGDDGSSLRCLAGPSLEFRHRGAAPDTYYLIVQSDDGVDFDVGWTASAPAPPPAIDTCAGAAEIPSAGGTLPGVTLAGALSDYTPTCTGDALEPDVYYRLVLTEPRKLTIDAWGAPDAETIGLALMAACGDPSTELVCDEGHAARVTRDFVDAGTYYLALEASAADPLTLAVRLDPPIHPPANDRCAGAIDVSGGGSFVGSTDGAYHDYDLSCRLPMAPSDVVYAFETTARTDVTLGLSSEVGYQGYVVALRTDCGDAATETACRSGNGFSFLRHDLPPGRHYVIVSGAHDTYGDRFTLDVAFASPTAAPEADVCTDATDVSAGGTFVVSTTGCSDDYEPVCAYRTYLPDAVLSLRLAEPLDVVLDFVPGSSGAHVNWLRGPCGSDDESLWCSGEDPAHVFRRSVPAGEYWILVDAASGADATLEVDLAPPTSACEGAEELDVVYDRTGAFSWVLTGTTEGRADEFTTRCGSYTSGAPDVPYMIHVPVRSEINVDDVWSRYSTFLGLRRSCDDPASQVDCSSGGNLAAVVDPGTYVLIVDNAPDGTGFYELLVTAAIRP
jgi:hypothetical protein